MAWVLDRARAHSRAAVEHAEVWGAAATSGDLARLRWLQERGFPWDGAEALAAVLKHADLGFIMRMEQEGGYLPPAGDESWASEAVVCAVAGSDQDSVPKLRWLAGRGAALGSVRAVRAAAARGDLAAVQLLVGHWLRRGGGEAAQQQGPLPPAVMVSAVESGGVPTAWWLLLQQGCGLNELCFIAATLRGDLPMLRWLLQAGCPRDDLCIGHAVPIWPGNTASDAEALVMAVQLLAAEGWTVGPGESIKALEAAARRYSWTVVHMLVWLCGEPPGMHGRVVCHAGMAGCEATLEAMLGMRVPE